MLDMDMDAFFEEQEQHMNLPEDDMDEFLARMQRIRNRVPDIFQEALAGMPSFDSISTPSYGEGPSNRFRGDEAVSRTNLRDGPPSAFVEPRSNQKKEDVQMSEMRPSIEAHISVDKSRSNPMPDHSPSEGALNRPAKDSGMKRAQPSRGLKPPSSTQPEEEVQMFPIATRKSPRRSNQTPLRASSPPSITPTSLKRKESPTKPEKPARKKAFIEESVSTSSPIKAPPKPARKPVSSKSKAVKKPPKPAPETIGLSMDPIEEPDFSVLVTRFEPDAQSTQPPQKVPAAGSTFLEMKEHIEKRTRERMILKAASRSKSAASTSAAKPTAGDESIILISSSPGPSSPKANAIVPIKASMKAKPKPKAKPAVVSKPKPPPKKAAGSKKERVKLYPKDYAQKLNETPPLPKDSFLSGTNLFYTGGDMTWASERTMRRMEIIKQSGGDLSPVYDPEVVTHIITEADLRTTLFALGLKSLKLIPEYIPVIKWKWVVDGMDDGTPGPLFEYAAFAQRVPPVNMPLRKDKGVDKRKGKERATFDADASRISAFTQDKKQSRRNIHDSEDDEPQDTKESLLISPPASPKASGSGVKIGDKDDPLAEFYVQAKAQRQAEQELGFRSGDMEESDMENDSDVEQQPQNFGPAPKRGWTCDNKNAGTEYKNGPNEFIAKKLEELMGLHKAKLGEDHHWRGISYQKCIGPIRRHPTRIKSYNEARSIFGVGHKIALKIMEIIETGELRRIDYENTPDVKIRAMFQNIYGVGQVTAYQWYAAGCRTLDDLLAGKSGVTLTPAQKIGIQFYDDIQDRMPRAEAKALFDLIKPIALAIDSKLEVQIMGSYRRGKADCGDIDIMITRNPADGKTHAGILHKLLKALHAQKIIEEDLALPDDDYGDEAIYRGLCHLPIPGSKRRRIDFLTIPWKCRGAALLYYTGDDIFNRAIRLKANKLGYSLNQRGLFEGVVRDPRNRMVKTNNGNCIASESEEEIFRILDVPYQEPHERVRG